MKKIVFIILSIITGILAVSASIEFGKILRSFSISADAALLKNSMFWFALGFLLYIFIYLFFKKKAVFLHVLGHELTHALWTLPFGGKADDLNVSTKGGRVKISKSNFLVSLAPYFFPFYAMIFTVIWYIAKDQFKPAVAFFIGAALSFHIALTLESMKTNQSDFKADSDFIFSLIFVYFMNIVMISLVLSVLSPEISPLVFLAGTFKGAWSLVHNLLAGINNGLK